MTKARKKKTAAKKAAPKGKGPALLFSKNKPFAVDCGTHGHLGDFTTEAEARGKKAKHLAEPGNQDDDVRVSGPQQREKV
jgi:hypothetical protein